MTPLYYNKKDGNYVTRDTALLLGEENFRRHYFLTKQDLIDGGGLPVILYKHKNSDYLIGFKDCKYKLVESEPIGELTLEPWAGEIALVEKNYCMGVIDANNGKILIPFDKKIKRILPISKDYFVVEENSGEKKILNRNNEIVDQLIGKYYKKENKLLRCVYNYNQELKVESRLSIKTLDRLSNTAKLRNTLRETVKELQREGFGLESIYRMASDIYYNKVETSSHDIDKMRTVEDEMKK